MGRPIKEGLDYFSFDVDFFQNIKIRKIKMACGSNALGILICLLCNIYKSKGYYIRWDEDMPFLIADEVGVSEGAVLELIKKAVQVNFFSKELSEVGILTSVEIQKRYKACTAKRDMVYENLEFWIKNELSEEIIEFQEEETKFLPPESTQSKVKESKVKESKVNIYSPPPNFSLESLKESVPIPEALLKIQGFKELWLRWLDYLDEYRRQNPRFKISVIGLEQDLSMLSRQAQPLKCLEYSIGKYNRLYDYKEKVYFGKNKQSDKTKTMLENGEF